MVKQNKGHWVTPFWHNDAHSRVTVTFGARRETKFFAGVRLALEGLRILGRHASVW